MLGYILLALLFTICSLLIGAYISGAIAKGSRFYGIGLKMLLASWITGLMLLVIALRYS